MGERGAGGFLEYKSRVVYSLLRVVARIGIRLRLPLDKVGFLLKMAYFQEARDGQGLELEPIADLFGKSLRTVSTLNRQFHSDFFAPEREIQFRRDLAALLNKRACARAEFADLFPERNDNDLAAALDDLIREGRVVETNGRYRRNPEDHDFFDEHDFARRIDGLNRQMDIIAETVWTRLADPNAATSAAARSYVFAASNADFERLIEGVLAKLRQEAIAADDAAQEQNIQGRRAITIAAVTLPGEDS